MIDVAPKNEGLSASWLKDELYAIFGALIQGLWVGEDLVYDASGNVTSWPGRIGPTLNNRTANLFTRNQTNGRLGLYAAANMAMAVGNASTGTGKSFWVATDGYSVAGDTLCVRAYNSSSTMPIYVLTGNTLWTSTGEVHLVNGLPSEAFPTSGPVIVEGYYPSTGSVGIEVGGYTGAAQAFRRTLPVVLQLSDIPTSIQRVKGVIALKRYLGIVPFTEQEALARDLVDILGSKLIGLWLGDDVITDATNKVTSWPSRVGAFTLTTTNGNFQRIAVSTRQGICNPDASYHALRIDSGFTAQSFITVAHSPGLPTNLQFGLIHPTGSTSAEAALLVTAASSDWYTTGGWTHYRDGVATTALAYGLHVYEADKATNTASGIYIGNWSVERSYPAPIMMAMALSTPPTAGERAAVTARLLDYYPTTAFDLFYKSHFDILGAKIGGLWIGDQLVIDGSNLVQSWPGYGGAFLPRDANRFRGSSLNSKRALIATVATNMPTQIASQPAKAYYMVAEMPATPITPYNIALDSVAGSGGNNPLTCYDTNRLWPGLATHYIDNVQTDYFTGERRSSLLAHQTNGVYGATIGWNYPVSPAYPWPKPVSLAAVLLDTPTVAERNAIDALHKSYYNTGVPLNADEIKAASIPVAGAVVIAPLTAALRSYGSLYNVPFALYGGGPVVTPSGASFNGTNGLDLDTGSATDFTIVARVQFSSLTGDQEPLLIGTPSPTVAGAAVLQYTGDRFFIHGIGSSNVDSGVVCDLNSHILTLRRSGTEIRLYRDGTSIAVLNTANTFGAKISIGYSHYTAYFFIGTISNYAFFKSALSDSDRLSVEGWAAT